MNKQDRIFIMKRCIMIYEIAIKEDSQILKLMCIARANELKQLIEDFTKQLTKLEYDLYLKIVEYYKILNP